MKVLFEKKGPIAYVTINRPERLNACDFETYGRLSQIWREFGEDPTLRVAIFTGAGERAFCAGSDIKSNYVEAAQRGTARRAVPGDVRADQADHRGDQRPRQRRRAGTGALLRYPGGRGACAVRPRRGSSRMASRGRRHAAAAATDSARPRARDALHRQPDRRRRGAAPWTGRPRGADEPADDEVRGNRNRDLQERAARRCSGSSRRRCAASICRWPTGSGSSASFTSGCKTPTTRARARSRLPKSAHRSGRVSEVRAARATFTIFGVAIGSVVGRRGIFEQVFADRRPGRRDPARCPRS